MKKPNSILTQYTLMILMLGIGLLTSYNCKSEGGGDPVIPKDTVKTVKTDVTYWLTKADQSVLLKKQNYSLLFNTNPNTNPTIVVDTTLEFQTIDGFGCALTGGSAYVINRLPATDRSAIIKELFANDSTSIGISYIRISIGASDLSSSVFSYDDMYNGQIDMNLTNFTLNKDRTDLIPVLQAALVHNPNIKILGSPWSAPAWMKTNQSSVGGSLRVQNYDVYARYLVKYIQGMQAEGIHIDAITPQNEPLNPYNNPSMSMTAVEQANFIKNNLGPALRAAGLTTKIIIYDHNCDHPEYPISILDDPDANPYIDGSAFHLYAGEISALWQTHQAHPDKNVYFTEQWVGGPSNFSGDLQWHTKTLIIGATRNWSKNVLEWNLASDPAYDPHTSGGCSNCEGALTIGSKITRNVSYYIMAMASKFVPSGSVRIMSDMIANLPNVAFKTPAGKKVLLVLNQSQSSKSFNIKFGTKQVSTTLAAGAVATYIW